MTDPASHHNNTDGLLVVIAGPSGSGKTTIRQMLLDAHPGDFVKSVSATTRPPRPGETHGVNYFFLQREEFERWIAEERFLEHAEYNQNLYGTPHSFIEEQLTAGRVVLLDIEVQGVQQLQEQSRYPLLTIFIIVNMDELARRLEARGTETAQQIGARLHRAQIESRLAGMFDHQVENQDLASCVDEIESLIRARRSRD
ncbi:MAG: guanylate kinase [Planctomycetota bacterium]